MVGFGIDLELAYDGTAYCGWQWQSNGRSIYQRLDAALSQLFPRPYSLLGASRTDAGVHALGQRAHLLLNAPCNIPLNKLHLPINARLPDDIAVIAARAAPAGFHPINDATSKTYLYQIYHNNAPNPLIHNQSLFVPTGKSPLNIAAMQEALPFFIGEHDFAAFCAAGSSVKSTVRTVYSLELLQEGKMITLRITGNGFLYNMVRIITGTLIEVGLGKTPPSSIPSIILSKDRTKAGRTAAARGLILSKIHYKGEIHRGL